MSDESAATPASFSPISREKYNEIRASFVADRDKHLLGVIEEWKRIGALLDSVLREDDEEKLFRLVGEIGNREHGLGTDCDIEDALIRAMWGEEATKNDSFLERFNFDFDLSDNDGALS